MKESDSFEIIDLNDETEIPSDMKYLIVMIKEGTDFPATGKHNKSDPYIRLWVDGEKVGKTQVIPKNNRCPVWNEEFLISRTEDQRGNVTLEVRDNRSMRKNITIGSTFFNFWDINEPSELVLYLDSEDFDSSLLVYCRPIENPPMVKNGKLPPFRIELDKSTYSPGEQVEGRIICNCKEDTNIKDNIESKFSGIENVRWTETRQAGQTTYTVTFKNEHLLFQEQNTHFEKPGFNKVGVLPAGNYCWDFSYTLPETGLFNSFQNKINTNTSNIEYTVFSIFPRKKLRSIYARSLFNLRVYDMVEYNLEDTLYDEKGKIGVTGLFNKRSVFLNGLDNKITAEFNIANQSEHDFVFFKITVLELQNHFGKGDSKKWKKWKVKPIQSKKEIPILSGEIGVIDINFEIDSVKDKLKPSLKGTNINIEHTIKVAAYYKKGLGREKYSVEFPIHVTNLQ
eukprot:TRINITY_DN2244_c0_g1_i3.p1 TRINITY_DN2244_c0_g1~~TRINITY_DN2244_c0_g1_i3.p1  ORF type:complete len:453 (-),score=102.53 TRINITY_DN2244_c0_g1_i3:69-1427(-)